MTSVAISCHAGSGGAGTAVRVPEQLRELGVRQREPPPLVCRPRGARHVQRRLWRAPLGTEGWRLDCLRRHVVRLRVRQQSIPRRVRQRLQVRQVDPEEDTIIRLHDLYCFLRSSKFHLPPTPPPVKKNKGHTDISLAPTLVHVRYTQSKLLLSG